MDDQYCVYCHIFPNGKRYIGLSKQTKKRWRSNGAGYKSQPKMANAIEKYGWNNIQHEILAEKLSKELANKLEAHFISVFDSIRNGYNVSKGGEAFNGTYLSAYILGMIRGMKRYAPNGWTIADLAYEERMDEEAAGFWNEASRAVVMKHGVFSATDEWEVASYWYYMRQYMDLYAMIQRGEDTSEWTETQISKAIGDLFFSTGSCGR